MPHDGRYNSIVGAQSGTVYVHIEIDRELLKDIEADARRNGTTSTIFINRMLDQFFRNRYYAAPGQ